MLQQVDDLLVSTPSVEQGQAVQKELQKHVSQPLYDLGIIKRYNGLDIDQTKYYIKIHATTYLRHIITYHSWKNDLVKNLLIPLKSDSRYICKLTTTKGPECVKEQKQLEKEMDFKY